LRIECAPGEHSIAAYLHGVVRLPGEERHQPLSLLNDRWVEVLFAYSVAPLALLDRDFNFVKVNQAYAEATGRTVEELAGRNHFELFPSDAKTIFDEVVRTKRPFTTKARPFVFSDHPEWGVTYWDWHLAPVLDDAGEVQLLVFSLQDVTSQVAGHVKERSASRASRLLSWLSLDRVFARKSARLVVPIGTVLEIVLFYGLSLFDSPRHYLGIPGPAATLIAIGAALVAGPHAGALVALVGGAAYIVFMADFGASVAWPTIVISIILWTVASVAAALVADQVRGQAATRESLLAQAVTDRDILMDSLRESEQKHRALAQENERLYRQQLQIAETLQTALLHIPSQIGRVRLGHLYRSATETARVGGDFYDVYPVRNDTIAVLMGDVSGHGIEAARTATFVKDVVNAFVHQSLSPPEVLRLTNTLLVERRFGGFVTAFLGIIDSSTGKLAYASAGHPEGLLRRSSGKLELLESRSLPLGALAGAQWTAQQARLGIDDLLFLYTDGLIEARRGTEFFGETRLRNLIEHERAPVERLPEVVLEEMLAFSGGNLNDDVAVLALSLSRSPGLSGETS
jgi:PAS domain S-box-containing protein